MTSFAANEIGDGWMPSFKIQGQVYHRVGPLHPQPGKQAKFLQIYFLGSDISEARRRLLLSNGAGDFATISALQKMLHTNNIYVRSFKTTLERAELTLSNDYRVVIQADKRPAGEHIGRYNAPSVDEVAILMVGEGGCSRDIVLHSRNSQLQRISDLHRAADALQYPLLFVKGDDGYDTFLLQVAIFLMPIRQQFCFVLIISITLI